VIKRVRLSIKKSLASIALLSGELLLVLILFILALLAFAFIAYRVLGLDHQQFDFRVFDEVGKLVSPGVTRFMLFITFFGNHKLLIPANILLVVYFLFIKKHRWYSIKVPVIAIGGVLIMFLLKQFFNRPRPLIPLLEPAKGLSFPSGHALMSVSLYGLLIFLVWENVHSRLKKWLLTGFLLLFILLIGFSRIYLRLHYFSDVMAGFAAGIIWLSLSIWFVRRIERFSKKEIVPVVEENKKDENEQPVLSGKPIH
jgi:membrane-associated phospholipid phosphatase